MWFPVQSWMRVAACLGCELHISMDIVEVFFRKLISITRGFYFESFCASVNADAWWDGGLLPKFDLP